MLTQYINHKLSLLNLSFHLADAQKQPHKYCMVVYYLPNNFVPKIVPHGNSKTSKPFYPTLPSTMSALKAECETSGPKIVVGKISARVGGIVAASDSCELPRGEQQVSDLKRRKKPQTDASGMFYGTDELAIVMQKAFLEDRSQSFIRDMKMLREPAIIVALDRQLNDLVKFCTNSEQFGIMTIDPTFCLGDFDVTVITYQHLLIQCQRTSRHPIFIGPVMIHYKKTFSTYMYFASTLVGLRPALSSVRCFGTDGEEPLFKAFQHAFPEAIHLLCSTHMRRNIKAKLTELAVDETTKQVVIADIYGKQVATHHIEGLVDSRNEAEFDQGSRILYSKWSQLGLPLAKFTKWFQECKCDLIKKCMLKPIRIEAGLGDPPLLFTTNASESINALLKRKVDYKKNELPEFLEKLKQAIDDQERELERAIIGRGKYRFATKFQHLTQPEEKWFLEMSVEQKLSHLRRVTSAPLLPKQNVKVVSCSELQNKKLKLPKPSCSRRLFSTFSPELGESSQTQSAVDTTPTEQYMFDSDESDDDKAMLDTAGSNSLSVSVSYFSHSVSTPTPILTAIWEKANELLSEENAVVKAPGYDGKARMVKSYSGTRPHLVVTKKSGQYSCDTSCPNWRSLNICAHVVAAAEDNQDLLMFVNWFIKAKKSVNITKLATTNMPAGRGRKGSIPPPKKKKKMGEKSRAIFSDVIQDYSSTQLPQRIFSCQGGSVAISGDGSLVTTGGNLELSLPRTPPMHQMPSGPPPLIRCASSSPDESTFYLAFIKGNIRVCRGCRQNYTKPAVPPFDLCVRHQEWQEFKGPSSNLERRFGNVYYHLNLPCIQSKFPLFDPTMLEITPNVAVQLLPVHTEHIMEKMPGRL